MYRLWRHSPIMVLAFVITFGGWGGVWLTGLITAAHNAAVMSQHPSSHQDFKFGHVCYRVPVTTAFIDKIIGDVDSKTILKVKEREGDNPSEWGLQQGKVPKRTLKGCEC